MLQLDASAERPLTRDNLFVLTAITMKIRCAPAICAVLCVLVHLARAADTDVNITCEKKRLALKHLSNPQYFQVAEKTEQWGYSISVENRTFKPLANLQVKYIIFYKHSELGVKGPPRKLNKGGVHEIPSVESLAKASFDTDPVTLTKASLVGPEGGYTYFANGAKPTVADTLSGVWVRIYLKWHPICRICLSRRTQIHRDMEGTEDRRKAGGNAG